MDDRARWHDLQAHLRRARTSLEARDYDRARAEVDAALEIDPDYLAALALRDRIANGQIATAPILTGTAGPAPDLPRQAEPRPLVSAEAWARFELRARERRIEHQLAAARAAIAHRNLAHARTALSEVCDLDGSHPSIAPLDKELDALEHAPTRRSRGPWVIAATAFASLVFGASWIEMDSRLPKLPIADRSVPVVALLPASPLAVPGFNEPVESVGTSGLTDALDTRAPVSDVADSAGPKDPPYVPTSAGLKDPPDVTPLAGLTEPPSVAAPIPSAVAVREPPSVPMPSILPGKTEPAAVMPPPLLTTAARAPLVPVAAASPDRSRTDEQLVRQTLERYRAAYEELDARLAQAVWPTVNTGALERAFAGLESQALTFDECNVQLRGTMATASCRGSARYLPKVGTRVQHVEPRTWSFSLRKSQSGWTIDTARADR